ncbi:MAG: DUF6483 family protein [Clostridia bacterium]|nr:DUF6483 family protein [Clostridia bacterium]
MYFQKDYILRMIEMMGDLMRRIQELLSDAQRMKLLEDACRTHCGISLETAEDLTVDSLIRLLPPVPRLMVSEILYIKADSFILLQEEKEALLHKSLHLLATLWEEGPLCEIRADRLAAMKNTLLPRLSPAELMNIARFMEEAERYGDMEDAIFQGLEGLPPGLERENLAREGANMLLQASGASGEALAYAHCTREELQASAEELTSLFGAGGTK